MGNIEEECEDAVFEVCDARERYPAYCAKKLSNILRLSSEIKTTNLKVDSIHINEIEVPLKVGDEKIGFFEKFESNLPPQNPNSKKNSTEVLESINDLITVIQQLRSEEFCVLNKCLKKFSRDTNISEK